MWAGIFKICKEAESLVASLEASFSNTVERNNHALRTKYIKQQNSVCLAFTLLYSKKGHADSGLQAHRKTSGQVL